MIQAVIGISDDIDIDVAAEEVLEQCRRQLGACQPQAGMLFSSCMDADFPGILSRILHEFPGLLLVGCTSDGEISSATGFSEDSLALLLLSSDTLEFATAIATNLSENGQDSLRIAYQSACQTLHKKPACAFLFPDGLTTIGITMGAAIRHAFGDSFPVFGGSSGDHNLFSHCYQFHNDKVYSDAAPMLVIAGDVDITSAICGGPIPIGKHFSLGRHADNIIYEIDDKTAVAFFQDYLGEYNEEFSEFPLAVYETGTTDYYLRNPLLFNEEDGSVAFIGTFPEHCTVRPTLVSRNDVLKATTQANRSVINYERGLQPELFFIFPCTWIRHILGSKANDIFATLRQHPDTINFFGFCCYGEIAPLCVGKPNAFHNDTYLIVAIRSRNT